MRLFLKKGSDILETEFPGPFYEDDGIREIPLFLPPQKFVRIPIETFVPDKPETRGSIAYVRTYADEILYARIRQLRSHLGV